MSIIKSYGIGHGDMFYIEHNSDNFTIIDCCIPADREEEILSELKSIASTKGITRFISTHPDKDHLQGLVELDDRLELVNFYCVKNEAKKDAEDEDFDRYYELRDSDKAYHIYKDCSRRWMNQTNGEHGSAGLTILWPDTDNADYKAALEEAKEGLAFNNMSIILNYAVEESARVAWMGDLDTNFMEDIQDKLSIKKIDVLFAPHHGRESERVPLALMDRMDPKLVIVGEAKSDHLHYYEGHDTITQNSAGDIVLDCQTGKVHVFTENEYDAEFLDQEDGIKLKGYHYAGTLKTRRG